MCESSEFFSNSLSFSFRLLFSTVLHSSYIGIIDAIAAAADVQYQTDDESTHFNETKPPSIVGIKDSVSVLVRTCVRTCVCACVTERQKGVCGSVFFDCFVFVVAWRTKKARTARPRRNEIEEDRMDVPASSKIFTINETKQLLAILMAPRTQSLFKDHKQHGTVWNYVYKCMKAKLPRFAKNTRQCYKKYVLSQFDSILNHLTPSRTHSSRLATIESADVAVSGCQKLRHSNWILTFLHRFTFDECHRYENLKGKYYELKRAELNGEQRPQWLYWKEMDYIVNQMPSNKLRTNLDHRISHINNTINTSTLNASAEQTRSATSTAESRDTKPIRLTIQSQDTLGKL